MKVLITGGAGFSGSHFIRYMLRTYADCEVVNLDKLTYAGNPANVADVAERYANRYRFIQGDIADASDVARAADGVDTIVNFAAETHVDRSITNPESFLTTDIMGTFRLLEYARSHPIKRFIQISTDEVYGSPETGESDESTPFQPNSPYAASKASADMLAHAYAVTYETPVIVTHGCNIYGSHQYPEKVIPLFITNLFEGKKVPVYGDGQQIREWIYIDDYCRAVDLVREKGTVGEAYNIGTNDRHTNLDTTKRLLALLGKDDSGIQHITDRPGHDRRYALNSGKIKSLGFTPEVDFDEGLKRTVSWYRENETWWKKIKSGEYLEYYKAHYKTQ